MLDGDRKHHEMKVGENGPLAATIHFVRLDPLDGMCMGDWQIRVVFDDADLNLRFASDESSSSEWLCPDLDFRLNRSKAAALDYYEGITKLLKNASQKALDKKSV